MRISDNTKGFTMVEMVIILAIITAISAMILFSFTGLNEGAALNRSAREVALALRRAQNMSLAVTRIQTSGGPRVPRIVGVQFSISDPRHYFIFADLNNNGTWDAGTDEKIGNALATFERGIAINAFNSCNPAPCPPLVNIMFAAPEAALSITNSSGADAGDQVYIVLKRPTGTATRTINIRTSGQINIK